MKYTKDWYINNLYLLSKLILFCLLHGARLIQAQRRNRIKIYHHQDHIGGWVSCEATEEGGLIAVEGSQLLDWGLNAAVCLATWSQEENQKSAFAWACLV